MSGTAFLKVKKLTGPGIIKKAARHNQRSIQAEIVASISIDPTRSHLNESLAGPATADKVAQLAKDLMAAAGVTKPRKDAVLGIEIVFSLPPASAIDDRAFFSDCTNWACAYFGGAQNILSADIHRDEATPHCHVLILPLIDGRMNGSDMIGGKKKLMDMQSQFHEVVAARYGLRKAPARLSSPAKLAASTAVLNRLRQTDDKALQSAAWPSFRAVIENDPRPFLQSMGIEVATRNKKRKSMTAIFTSKGKGAQKEAN